MADIQIYESPLNKSQDINLSPKSSSESTVASQKKSRKKSLSRHIFYIDEQLLLEQTKIKQEEIFEWFHTKGIKHGNPQNILLDYQETQRKRIFQNNTVQGNQRLQSLKPSPINFGASSLLTRRLSKKQSTANY